MTREAGPLAVVVRGGVVESVHAGHLVVLRPDGSVLTSVGDPDATIWARSSLKPLQAAAMLDAGLSVDDEGLALACASHSGTAEHLAVVRRVLAGAGLSEADLQNTPDLPLDAAAAFAWRREGHGPASITQNCSGKHAAMLATCVANGWDTASYRSPEHPLQARVRETIERLTGVPVAAVTVDGCGAPLFSTTVRGLAAAFGGIAAAAADDARDDTIARIGRAMRSHPILVGGPGRDVSRFMAAVPGLVAKDGAEGVYGAGFADGTGVAFKIADGSARARPVILGGIVANRWQQDWSEDVEAAAIQELYAIEHVPVLGHGEPVGAVHAFLSAGSPGVERAVVGRRWE